MAFGRLGTPVLEDGLSSTYIGDPDTIRDLVAAAPEPRQQGFSAGSRFRLRQMLVGQMHGRVYQACRDAAGNDNIDLIEDRICRLAGMAVAGERTAQIGEWLSSLPFSPARKGLLLAEAARRVGSQWACDDLDFVTVTTAVGRLQYAFRHVVQSAGPARRRGGSVFVTTVPGEEHVFGVMMVEEIFRASGWAASVATPKSMADLGSARGRPVPDVLCVSWSSDVLGDAAAAFLEAFRGRGALIVFGGQAALRHADWLAARGVDYVCDNPYAALDFCHSNLLKQRDGESFQAEQDRAARL